MGNKSPGELRVQQSISSLVSQLQKVRGPQKQELAAHLGITPDNLSHTLTPRLDKRRRWWKVSDLLVLSEYYDVSLEVLTRRDEAGWDELVLELLIEEAEQQGLG